MAFGVAREKTQLTHEILDIMHDEGEAPVEFIEAASIGKRLLSAGLG